MASEDGATNVRPLSFYVRAALADVMAKSSYAKAAALPKVIDNLLLHNASAASSLFPSKFKPNSKFSTRKEWVKETSSLLVRLALCAEVAVSARAISRIAGRMVIACDLARSRSTLLEAIQDGKKQEPYKALPLLFLSSALFVGKWESGGDKLADETMEFVMQLFEEASGSTSSTRAAAMQALSLVASNGGKACLSVMLRAVKRASTRRYAALSLIVRGTSKYSSAKLEKDTLSESLSLSKSPALEWFCRYSAAEKTAAPSKSNEGKQNAKGQVKKAGEKAKSRAGKADGKKSKKKSKKNANMAKLLGVSIKPKAKGKASTSGKTAKPTPQFTKLPLGIGRLVLLLEHPLIHVRTESACKLAPLTSDILEAALKRLWADFKTITVDDCAIYNHEDDGTVLTLGSKGQSPEKKKSNAANLSDAQWEEQVRRELAAKNKDALTEQRSTRARVSEIVRLLLETMEIVGSCGALEHLELIDPFLSTELDLGICRKNARRAFFRICKRSSLAPIAWNLASGAPINNFVEGVSPEDLHALWKRPNISIEMKQELVAANAANAPEELHPQMVRCALEENPPKLHVLRELGLREAVDVVAGRYGAKSKSAASRSAALAILPSDHPVRFVLAHDEEVKELWEDPSSIISPGIDAPTLQYFEPLFTEPSEGLRRAAGAALVALHDEPSVMRLLHSVYKDATKHSDPRFARTMADPQAAIREDARVAVANALGELRTMRIFDILLEGRGLADPSGAVRSAMLDAGMLALDASTHPEDMFSRLDSACKSMPGAVVLLAKCACASGGDKWPLATTRLIKCMAGDDVDLATVAASNLPPLVKLQGKIPAQLLPELLRTGRAGLARGLALAIKAQGISSVKPLIPPLREALTDISHGSVEARVGALLAVAEISRTLGILFEPFILPIFSLILDRRGDKEEDVRNAGATCLSAVMSKLTSHGMKLTIPGVVSVLSTSGKWRAREAAALALSAIASCSARQRASTLPKVLPVLSQAALDTKKQVAAAAKSSLGALIETMDHPSASLLAEALADPTAKNASAALALLGPPKITAPLLSLAAPVIKRAPRRDAAKAVARLCMAKDIDVDILRPHAEALCTRLELALLDSLPDVRLQSARALGSLVRALGEETFPSLVDTLREKTLSDTSSLERGGAAQGLIEVLAGIGPDRLESVILNEAFIDIGRENGENEPFMREGVMWTFAFLPIVLGMHFASLIDIILPRVIEGLADSVDMVREVAMRSANVIIEQHAEGNPMISNVLEEALLDGTSWRVRDSAVQLLPKLPESCRPRMLPRLYMMRTDEEGVVRQSALQAWKKLVENTPKVLRAMLDDVLDLIAPLLSSDEEHHRTLASGTIADVVAKLGSRVLPKMVPALLELAPLAKCIGLHHLVSASTKDELEPHLRHIVPALQDHLGSKDESVRNAAAEAFDALREHVPAASLCMPLIEGLESGDESSIVALRGILSLNADEILPVLIPKLLGISEVDSVITSTRAKALETVAQVAGRELGPYVRDIIPKLLHCSEEEDGKFALGEVVIAVQDDGLNWAISELAKPIHQPTEHQASSNLAPAAVRERALWAFGHMVANTKADYCSDYLPMILKSLLGGYFDEEEAVRAQAISSVDALIKNASPKEAIFNEIEYIRSTLSGNVAACKYGGQEVVAEDGDDSGKYVVPAFTAKRGAGLKALMDMLLDAVKNAHPLHKQKAADTIAEIVEIAPADALRTFFAKLAGGLIRVMTDQYSGQVKQSVLRALLALLKEGGAKLRAFISQLQTTFLKSLRNFEDFVLRGIAVKCLKELCDIVTRVDPLVKELVKLISSEGTTAAVRGSALECLDEVFGRKNLVEKISEGVMSDAQDVLAMVGEESAGSNKKESEKCFAILSRLRDSSCD
eukprot:g1597.t1